MTKAMTCKVQMRPLGLDLTSIRAAAKTISLSFASDPLIRWLSRDRAGPGWETLTSTLQQWQEARLREYAVRGIGMEAVTMGENPSSVGACFIFPPKSQYRWLNPLWWPAYLRILWDDWVAKPMEPFSDGKRIELMMDAHNEFEEKIKSQYPPNSLYYLEIAAVRPDTQGMGVGSTIMAWVIQKLGTSPCFLECTAKDNVKFYEKYGFRVVEEKTLSEVEDPTTTTTLYYMVRD